MTNRRNQSLPDNTRVQLRGLMSRVEMNGQIGTIAGYDESNDRYVIQVTDPESGKTKEYKLKPDNLIRIDVTPRGSDGSSSTEVDKPPEVSQWNT